MVKHSTIAQEFSEGAVKGTGSRMFIEGDTVYSYGYHFPIAIRKDGFFLFNSEGYSSSTANHKGYVRYALLGEKVIELMGCNLNCIEDQIKEDKAEMEILKGKHGRARLNAMKEAHQQSIREREHNIQLLIQLKGMEVKNNDK